MSKLRQLIEAANRKCEMAWKVYSYNPEKDNELVDTSKAFDCIAAAQAHKREILEKNPNYTVEIIAESSQKNEEVTKSNYKSIINDLEAVFKKFAGGDLKLEHKKKPNSFDLPLDTCLSVPLKDKAKLEPVKAALKKVIDKYGAKKVAHKDDFAYNFGETNKDGIYVGWNWNADRAFLGYAVNPDFDIKYLGEAAQKNEDFYKEIDDVPTREIAKAIKELGIKEPYATQKAKIADKLAKHFGLRRVPTPIEMTTVLDALPYFTESAQKNEDKIYALGKYNGTDKENLRKRLTHWGLTYGNPDAPTEKIVDKLVKDFPELAKYKKEIIDKVNAHKKKHYADYDDVAFEILTRTESSQKSESKVNMSKLKNEIQAAVNKYFKNDKDLLEYVHIDTKKDKLGRDILEVRAELGYNDMVKLADHLDKIVTKYDRYAYFDQETSGIMTAVFESAQKNEDLSKHPKLQEIWSRWKFNTKYGLHYTSNAKDTQAYLAKITKPNTFWLEDEDTGKAIVQGTPKDLINFMLSHKDTVEESAQINESLRDLNLELADDTNAIAASADKIRQRFEYRTLQNQSYDEKQAEKIYLEIRRELEKAKKMIDACYNKIG